MMTLENVCQSVATSRGITDRQCEVLKLMAKGYLCKQIAYELDIGEATVKAHVTQILKKIGVYNKTQVAVYVYKEFIKSMANSANEFLNGGSNERA